MGSPRNKSKVPKFIYPKVHRDLRISDLYHGKSISDPYRWLEKLDSEETMKFIEDQNGISVPYLQNSQWRPKIQSRLAQLYEPPRYTCPRKYGEKYYYSKTHGLEDHSIIYSSDEVPGNQVESEPSVFLDPNHHMEVGGGGSISISQCRFSQDGTKFAFGVSQQGSDWLTIYFKDVLTGQIYPEVLEWVKLTPVIWIPGNSGVFYVRHVPEAGQTNFSPNMSQKLFFHKLGTLQAEDILIVEFPEAPKSHFSARLSDCGTYLVIHQLQHTGNLVFIATFLTQALEEGFRNKLELVKVVETSDFEYDYVTNTGALFYFLTNGGGASNSKIVGVNLREPFVPNFIDVLPEHESNVLCWAAPVHEDKLIVCYMRDVKHVLELRQLADGSLLHVFPIGIGSVTEYSISKDSPEFFFKLETFLTFPKMYRVDLRDDGIEPKVIFESNLPGFQESNYEVTQVFYRSKDATKIPMYIIHRKGSQSRNGTLPCNLFGYGGFKASTLPAFSFLRAILLQNFDCICVIASIRGGGEYGRRWYDGGRVLNKQKSFDDFQAGAEYLIRHKYTSPDQLAIHGTSNGGLLVGACINQRPDLFKVAVIEVGLLDMLRFHKFTVGPHWKNEYGNVNEKRAFESLVKISPLHNIQSPKETLGLNWDMTSGGAGGRASRGIQYPATLVLTGDHDDRVVPSHSYKYIAELQYRIGRAHNQTNPLMLWVQKDVGHEQGQGKSPTKQIEEITNILTFMSKNLDLTFND